jgi:hypothetical protein
MLRKNRLWTREDDQKLLALAAAGRSSLLLAAAMKRSKSAVVNRLSTLRLRERMKDDRECEPQPPDRPVAGKNRIA